MDLHRTRVLPPNYLLEPRRRDEGNNSESRRARHLHQWRPESVECIQSKPLPTVPVNLQLTSLQPLVYIRSPRRARRPAISTCLLRSPPFPLVTPSNPRRTYAFHTPTTGQVRFSISCSLSVYLSPRADRPYTQPVFTTTSPNSTVSLRQITSRQTRISFTPAFARRESSSISSTLKCST